MIFIEDKKEDNSLKIWWETDKKISIKDFFNTEKECEEFQKNRNKEEYFQPISKKSRKKEKPNFKIIE